MKRNLIIFSIGLALGLFLSYLYSDLFGANDGTAVSKKQTKKFNKIEVVDTAFAGKLNGLAQEKTKLQLELRDTRSALATARAKSYSLQQKVFNLMGRRYEAVGTIEQPEKNCDSLFVTVDSLIKFTNFKDSLFEKINDNLQEQLNNQDSLLLVKDDQYRELQSSFRDNIECIEALLEANRQLQKTTKRQKAKSKLFGAALLIITGVIAASTI